MKHVVEHRIDFVGEKHSQLLTNDFNAQGMNSADYRRVFVVESLQSRVDIFPELPRDDTVESDYQNIMPVSCKSRRVEDTLDAAH
jgi:hypothetical protein